MVFKYKLERSEMLITKIISLCWIDGLECIQFKRLNIICIECNICKNHIEYKNKKIRADLK